MSSVLRRDEFGEKPLYYYVKADGMILTSDRVLGLLAQGVPRKLSRLGLMSYLTYGAVATPLTMIEGVSMLPAGHELVDGKPMRYWKPSFAPVYDDLRSAQAAVTGAVRKVVSRSMREDRSHATAFLSGGIDSSAIVAVMRQLYDGEIRTYCVKHDDDTTEESAWAQKVAERNHTKHTVLHLTDAMVRGNILTAISSYDQPTLDGLNFWFACKLVKEAGETSIFSGEGGDELFAGYDRFAKHVLAYRWADRLTRLGSHVWGGPVGHWVEALSPNEKYRKLGALMAARCDPYSIPRKVFSPRQVQAFLRPELRTLPRDYQQDVTAGYAPDRRDIINRISWLELQTVTTDMWLRDGYQTAAAHGLNVETPLLDKALAELLFTIPGAMKCCPEYQKPLLVRAAGEGLPLECVTRKKQGFTLPFERYFEGDLKDIMKAFLDGKDLALFEPRAIRDVARAYLNGRISWSRLWTLFVAEHWCKQNRVEVA